ncbi:tryptophan synthase subunit alpha [Zophobihabitans entericus]|uniref:Tryptophan synthase alpha chain n=1 Tax=Zophobihabitans entericus TaxID=1635327 RepID=A0A6G9I967_9GAMM|nr:tryptophan synthase subunit alpha [Zophobihabitans entericus]QIQ20264.1 tryptophan synthase subunit alpha [Zophobihabitans entericus]
MTASNRYQALFTGLNVKKEGAFIPFVTLGDPTPQISLDIIDTLVTSGADALELGIPFSDPLADGPTIQNATLRAFAGGITVAKCFEMLTIIRSKYPDLPIGVLVYANLVFRGGIDSFYARCAKAGVDSVLVADVPLEESEPFRQAALAHDIDPIFICPPNATPEVIQQIALNGSGYTYLVSRSGVTGAENSASQSLTHLVKQLAEAKAPPAIQGFGISKPKQVKETITSGAMGAISGSAVVNIIARHLTQPEQMKTELMQFCLQMKGATKYN